MRSVTNPSQRDTTTFFFSVGEPSGDLHGANLIAEMRKRSRHARFVGYGGPRMQKAGCELHQDLASLAVMWVTRAILRLPQFLSLLWRADRYFRNQRPDAVILIDFPGFNWWIARRAKARNIPVFYYGTPQVWAWASWRVRKMRKFVDHVLCKLPFEQQWFRQRGCNAHFVGHPYFDELSERQLDHGFLRSLQQHRPLVTLLPGSRKQEVASNLPWMVKAAESISKNVPEVQFGVGSFNNEQAAMTRRLVAASPAHISVFVDRTPELIHAATCCIACSGSVSLELLYHGKPSVIIYRISRWANVLQRLFRRVRYISLVNLLATDDIFRGVRWHAREAGNEPPVPFPEFLTSEDKSADIAAHIVGWLEAASSRQECIAQLERIRDSVARGGASQRAAEYILREVSLGRRQPRSRSRQDIAA